MTLLRFSPGNGANHNFYALLMAFIAQAADLPSAMVWEFSAHGLYGVPALAGGTLATHVIVNEHCLCLDRLTA